MRYARHMNSREMYYTDDGSSFAKYTVSSIYISTIFVSGHA